jgi:hypothetical protein
MSFRAGTWREMDSLIIFRCPKTGLDVQTYFARKQEAEDKQRHYEGISCPSCSGLHFINRETGKLLGREKD